MKNKVTRILWMLVAEFFLGMGLNLIGQPTADMATYLKVVSYVLIALHILNALGMLVTAIQLWLEGSKAKPQVKKLNLLGLASLLLATAGGILTVSAPWAELWSFVMATGFILAVIFFGKLLLELSKPKLI